eukprot:scaffold603_cov404-Prasinococcus_capsulatus_cf.AAC.19
MAFPVRITQGAHKHSRGASSNLSHSGLIHVDAQACVRNATHIFAPSRTASATARTWRAGPRNGA